ncbi:MAG: large subunit ribosomal protein [Clostridia bacterium]|nr:large subunit ribosomal protein [Clostridia bacterium]
MATCTICGKKASTGNQVSHSNIKTKRTWQPNLQRVRIIVNGSPKKAYVCTRCLRSGKVQRAI